MDKRYQVFVSSTYADLKQERQNVTQALMEMDCIPAGMELFPAADEEQWEFIKRVIDDCDYYLLIIGGRYGSTTPDGISYTEKEFDYAVESGIPVIALLHENPDEISVGKSDIDPALRESLKRFRERVSENRLVRFWKSADQLPGLVALSLSKTIKAHPAVGWIRADRASNETVLSEINNVRRENAALVERLREFEAAKSFTPENLAGLEEKMTINGERFYGGDTRAWKITVKWEEIFAYVSPYLIKPTADAAVKHILLLALRELRGLAGSNFSLSDQDFQTISVQLKALGLVNIRYAQTVKGDMALFWSLTSRGEKLMYELRTQKKGQGS